MKKNTSHYLIIFSSLIILGLSGPMLAEAATLSLSPSSGTYTVGETFDVEIRLNTGTDETDGTDVHFLRFSSSLEVVDADAGKTGTQIRAGSLYTNTIKNSVNNTAGTIDFSQTTSGGAHYTGSGTLATITFEVKSSGTANVDFDFISGSTDDTNVASAGNDVLTKVTDGSYTLNAQTLTVSLSADPSSGDAPLNDVNLTADVSGTATGTINYRFWCDCNSTCDTVAGCTTACGTPSYGPPATTTDPYTATNVCDYATADTYTAKVVAERGTLSAESRVTINVISVDLKVATDSTNWQDSLSGYIPLNGVDLKADVSGPDLGNINYTFYCNRSDAGTNITAGYCKKEDGTSVDPYTVTDCCDYASAGTYTVKVIAERGGLAAEKRATVTVDYKETDLNKDGYIDSLDYSLLITDWGEVTVATDADINDDGIVNSIDWSLMNKDWSI